MTVATYQQTNNTTQTGAQYLANIDANMSVLAAMAADYAPHAAATPNMTALVDAGALFYNGSLVSNTQQITGTITAPASGYNRIDRVVVDQITGLVTVVTGTPTTGVASAPAIPSGKFPCAQISLTGTTTAITNSMITDERCFIATGQTSGGSKNVVINGNFDHWQRGVNFPYGSPASYFSADRWAVDVVGSTTSSSQQAFTLGQTAVPFESAFFHRAVVVSTAAAGNYSKLRHSVEWVRTLAGQTATLSFWAKADAPRNMAVEFGQCFGIGGGASAAVTGVQVTTCALTTSWQKFTITVNVPSIAGKIIGTQVNDYLGFNFWFDAGSIFNSRTNTLGQQSGTFDIAQVQLEPGGTATAFEKRPWHLELALCQRFYEFSNYNVASGGGSAIVLGATAAGASSVLYQHIPCKVTKRVTSAGGSTTISGSWTLTNCSLSLYNSDVSGAVLAITSTAAGLMMANSTYSGNGIIWSAEIYNAAGI